MGRRDKIKNLCFHPEYAVYRRADGRYYSRISEQKHARVEKLGSVKQWTFMGKAETLDPEEEVEVILG